MMSRISAGLEKTIKEIKRLSDGSIDEKKACKELLQKKIFPFGKLKTGIPVSIIPELLPTIIKFMESDDHALEEEGAQFIMCITHTPDRKTHTKLVTDSGGIPKLINLISSTNTDVLISALEALVNITHDFPEKFVENEILQSMIHYLKSENPKISYEAAKCMTNISQTSEHVAVIFEARGVKPLIEILESKNDDVIEWALIALLNITSCNNQFCQCVLDLGGLKSLKKLCDRLLVVKKPKSNNETDLKNLRERKAILLAIKISAIEFFEIVTSYGEAQVDLIINDNFIPIILKQIQNGLTPLIKIGSIKVIENVISAKRDFIPALVQDYNIFSLLYSNLRSTNADLVITSLTAMCNIIEVSEDRDSIRQKIRECDGPTKLTNLCKHSNEEVRQLSTMLYEFIFDVKPDPIVGVSGESDLQEPELIDLDDSEDDDTPSVETSRIGRQRKRPAYPSNNGPLRRSKRFRVSLEERDTDNIDNSSSDDDNGDENHQYDDFDDHPINSSPVNWTPDAAPTDSNRNDHSGRQSSSVGDDTIAVDYGPSRLNPKRELSSPIPHDFDIPATSASRQSPDLPVASASTMNEIAQDEIKPSPAGRLGNRSRLSSNHSHVKPEDASTNDGNIRLTPKTEPTPHDLDMPSRQPLDLPMAASTMNKTAQNERKLSVAGQFGNPSRLSSINSHVVPEDASTRNEENIRNNHSGRSTAVDSEIATTADESVRNDIKPLKQSPTDDDLDNPLSRPISAIAPALPVVSASANNRTIPNDIPSRKASPAPQSSITLNLTNQVTPPDAVATANNDGIIRDEIVKYWRPAEFLIHQFCDTLEIQFSRDNYVEFISKIKFIQITSNSKPSNIYQPIDQSGFGCFSILLTGNEDSSSKIRDKINRKFIDFMDTFDKEKIKDVTLSPIMLAEHLETIATWLKCRILVYCNGWKKYGNWDTDDQMIPLFVLNKKEIQEKTEYCIVLTLKNE